MREHEIMRARGLGDFSGADSLEAYFAVNLPRVFQYLLDRGPIIRALFNDRAVAGLLRADDAAHRASQTAYYLASATETFAVDERTARLGVILTANAPVASARALRSFGIEPKDAAEFWTTFLMGGWAAVSAMENFPKERG